MIISHTLALVTAHLDTDLTKLITTLRARRARIIASALGAFTMLSLPPQVLAQSTPATPPALTESASSQPTSSSSKELPKEQPPASSTTQAPEPTSTKPITLTIYSSRNKELLSPVLDLYKKKTGNKVQHHSASAGMLIEKIKAEKGPRAPDILITVDAGNLWASEKAGLLLPIKSPALESSVPKHFRDPNGHWWGVSLRLRTLFYNPKKIKASQLSTYADLADPKWQGQLCLRTSQKVYNQSLVAMLIWHHGAEKTKKIVEGWVANLATHVFSSDTKLIEAVAAGQCAIGIANSYYFGRLLRKNPDLSAQIFWANQGTESTGVHANISGAAVLKNSNHPGPAQKFIEFLLSNEAQDIFASLNYEYPVRAGVPVDPLIKNWGKFRASNMPLSEAGRRQGEAIALMDHAKYR